MLSLTKKSDAQPATAPLWHPNFRNFERLPDTKVVRTTFFINTAAIAVALGLLIWVGNREYTLYSLKEQISQAKQQIATNERQSKEAIRLTGLFAQEQKKLSELESFVASPIRLLDFIGALGKSLSPEIAIDSVDARIADTANLLFTVRGKVVGAPDKATGTASNYVDGLRKDTLLGTIFDPITLTSINRDPQSGLMIFEIVFTGSSAKGKK